jgi:hypothetical protein
VNRNLKTASAIVFMGAVVLLAGCSQNTGPAGKHSIEWYAKHTAERHKELNWCKQLPAKDHWSVKWTKSPAGIACCEARNGTKGAQYNVQHGYETADQLSQECA